MLCKSSLTIPPCAALAVIGADFYGNPADKLHLIGITGNKGQDHDRAADRRDHDRGRSALRPIGSNGGDIAGCHEATANTTPEALNCTACSGRC